jgi:hypothetical protein
MLYVATLHRSCIQEFLGIFHITKAVELIFWLIDGLKEELDFACVNTWPGETE